MYYETSQHWRECTTKRVMLFGMSGLGKTHVSNILRDGGGWFHYSVDYRIGTRYMGEHIVDNFKREAMRNPFLSNLLRTDSIYIASNITFDNLSPLSTYLGKPGDPGKGGIAIDEYRRRQAQHHQAEVAAMLDTPHFIGRAQDIYGYPNFVCDTSGSICEVVDPDDPDDPVLSALSRALLPVWIRGTEDHAEELVRRFEKAPKPMCYRSGFLNSCWTDYLAETGAGEADVDPDHFMAWTFRRAVARRLPLYRAMAENWGITVEGGDMAQVRDPQDFTEVIAAALDRRTADSG